MAAYTALLGATAMLDLTVIFLVAGYLFGASSKTAQDRSETSTSPAERERMRLHLALAAGAKQPRTQTTVHLQWILGGIVVVVGIVYAIVFAVTIPGSEGFSFGTSRLLLIKLLPSAALGILAGAIVRIGLRSMNPYFLALGAIFVVLPFLFVNGAGMLKNFNKIKVGPWFEADINSTEQKIPVQMQLQFLEDRSEGAGFSALTTTEIAELITKDEMARTMCLHIPCSVTDGQAVSPVAIHAKESVAAGPANITGIGFYCTYMQPLLNQIARVEDGSLLKERAIRESVDPVAKAGAALLQTARKDRSDDDWRRAWFDFRSRLGDASADLGRLSGTRETVETPDTGGNSVCAGRNSLDATLIPSRDFATTVLPHILIARLYRRAGSDARALRVLDDAQGVVFSGGDDLSKASEWAGLLVERGDLRYSLGVATWKDDWRAAVTLQENILARLWYGHSRRLEDSEIEKSCNSTPPADSLEAIVARLELDNAQLRNRYVFTLIDDNRQRRAVTMDETLLEDVVTAAQQNYLEISRLSLLSRCLPQPVDPESAPCIDVVYPDTLALALLAAAQQEDPASQQDTSIRVGGLLQESLDAVQQSPYKKCPKGPKFLHIIHDHQKLARSLML